MASAALLKTVASYDDYYDRKGNDEKLLNAYCEAAKVAILTERDIEYGLKLTSRAKWLIEDLIKQYSGNGTFWSLERYGQEHEIRYSLVDKGYEMFKIEAPYLFESYLFYVEKKRKYEKRFYVPRRKTLNVVVQDLQDLEDDKLDVYGLSEPSRVGKTTTIVFFISWIGLKRPQSHNAYGGHSGQLAKRFFRGLSNVVEDPEYTFAELFQMVHPEMRRVVENKSSDPAEFTINLGKRDEFSTFTCRGIDATWTGAIDVSSDGYLTVDDLVRDREHSMSQSRMENTYQEYQNKMIDRMNDGAKRLLIGTLWGVGDPIERERRLNANNPRARFRKIPALNENDESNFQYEVNGFSTQYYIDMRNRLERPEWMAKYQQQPFVREGLLFPIETLRFFDGEIPDTECRTVAALDPAFGRGDSLSMPICKDFGGTDKYIVDWVHDKRTPGYTVPIIVDKIEQHMITELKVEKNRGGDLIAENIQKEMDSRNVFHCRIVLESAPVRMSKEDKIGGHSDFVKRYFQFLLPGNISDDAIYKPDEGYRRAIDELTIYSPEGKNANDDAPDSITQLAMMFEKRARKKATITRGWV